MFAAPNVTLSIILSQDGQSVFSTDCSPCKDCHGLVMYDFNAPNETHPWQFKSEAAVEGGGYQITRVANGGGSVTGATMASTECDGIPDRYTFTVFGAVQGSESTAELFCPCQF